MSVTDNVFKELEEKFNDKIYNYEIFNDYITCQIDAPISVIFDFIKNITDKKIIEDYSIREPTIYDIIQNLK